MVFQPSGPDDCRVAIVTGGSRGIGRATAQRLSQLGYAVVVNYVHNQRRAEVIVEAILDDRGAAVAIRADVSDELDVERLFAATIEAFGAVDALVHAVRGHLAEASVAEIALDDLDAMLRTSSRAAFMVNREAARHVRDGGAIVNLTSSVSTDALPRHGAYAVTAAGIDALSRLLAHDLRDRNISVNAVSLDIDKPCEPDRAAELITHLLSDAGRAITGQVLHLDDLPHDWAAAADR